MAWASARAVGFLVAALLVYLGFVATAVGQAIDARAFGGGGAVRAALTSGPLAGLRTGIVLFLAGLATVVGLTALARRRIRPVAMALVLVAGVVGATSVLRRTLPRPYLGDYAYIANTLPSVHAAAAASLVLAIGWMLPAQHRGIEEVAAAAVLVASAGYSSVVTFAHRPSDVLAGILMVGAFGSVLRPLSGVNVGRAGSVRARSVPVALTAITMVAWGGALALGPRVSDLMVSLAGISATLACAWWVVLLTQVPSRETDSCRSSDGPAARVRRAPGRND